MRFDDIDQYKQHFLTLIELERKAEMEFHLNEIRQLSGREREKKGRAILNLSAKYMGELLGYKTYRFGNSNMPDHQIKVGDVVLISRSDPLKEHIEATVSAVGKSYIEVMSRETLFSSRRYRMDLFVNDITFKRMKHAVNTLQVSLFSVDVILGRRKPVVKRVKRRSEKLNESQNEALAYAVDSELFLIHGPPGTGKTTTLAEAIRANLGKRILVCADSNVAVDNVMEHFKDRRIVRIGHPARIDENLLKHSIEHKIVNDEEYMRKAGKIDRRIEKLKERQSQFKKPTPATRRGFSNDEIVHLAKRGVSKRGISTGQLFKMAQWIILQERINKLYEKKNSLIQQISRRLIEEAEIVFTTNSGAGSELLENEQFDVVFIDEAAQATEPSALIPLTRAKRAILAGDHKQLPPTVLSEDARDLNISIFERFMDLYKPSRMLTVQYRMNETICRFPSCEFYSCRLKPHESVKNIKLSDIARPNEFIGGDTAVVFFDTKGRFLEVQKEGSTSRYNPREAEFVKHIVYALLSGGLKEEDIGIITPYKDHEEFLKRIIESVEIKSVDGFQGREKEVIVLSLVRANEKEQIGFLKDKRRLNVAITRAKRKLIIVGDAATVNVDRTYRRLFEYIKENGLVMEL